MDNTDDNIKSTLLDIFCCLMLVRTSYEKKKLAEI